MQEETGDSDIPDIPTDMEQFLDICSKTTENVMKTEEPKLTGSVIGRAIVKILEDNSLSSDAAIGQSYDGASVMSSVAVGTCAVVKEVCLNAEYYHCSAHTLNLTLVHACELPSVRDMVATVKKVTTFL